MIKLIINLLNFAFKCRLVTETHVIALIQAGMQAKIGQRDWSRRQHKILLKTVQAKVSFFWRLKRDVHFNFCVS